MARENVLNLPYYLRDEEKDSIAFLIGQRCTVRASAIVQLFGTDPPVHSSWSKRCCGVAVFVKDNARRSFYIQVFEPEIGVKAFEQEIYSEFQYEMSSVFFHQFEGDNAVIGLNFADNEEAIFFGQTIKSYVENRKKKEESVKQNAAAGKQENKLVAIEENAPISDSILLDTGTASPRLKKKKRTSRLRKSQIGLPENFRHVSHVGFNKDGSSTHVSEDALLAYILEKSQIKPAELQDANIKEMFLTFIESNGGIKNVYEKIKSKKQGLFQGSLSTQHSSSQKTKTKSEVAFQSDKKSSFDEVLSSVSPVPSLPSQYVKPTAIQPPPPPPLQKKPTIPSIVKSPNVPVPATSTMATSKMGPPPPPPVPPAPVPSMQQFLSLPQGGETRDQGGVEGRTRTNSQSQENLDKLSDQSSRDDLLSEIRNPGFKLRKVSCEESSQKPPLSGFENSLIASLAQTLKERSIAVQGSSSEDDEEDDSNDELDSDSDGWN